MPRTFNEERARVVGEREKTREFYQKLLKRSEQAKKKPDSLIPLDESS